MKISKVVLKGWKSFSNEEGISLDNFKHINIIIGPNNAGKSNLFKYFFYLRNMLREFPDNEQIDEIYTQKNYGILNYINKAFQPENTWAWLKGDIQCDINTEEISFEWKCVPPKLHAESGNCQLHSFHNCNDNKTCLSVAFNETHYLLDPTNDVKPKAFSQATGDYRDMRLENDYPCDTLKYWIALRDSLVFIDPIRHYDRNTASVFESDFDGSKILEQLEYLSKNNLPLWVEYVKSIETWLMDILGEDFLRLELKDSIRFFMSRGGETILTNLTQLGTGVAQLFMMLSYLFINKDRSLNVFMEEPECNLHPEAVLKLILILEQSFVTHRFYISTHSSTLIDQLNNTWSIHRIVRKSNGSSIAQQCNGIVRKYELLDELGIRASQLLQSNLVIWVEGPSDRIYLNKWIKDLADIPLVEGKHYSFLMYGGTNLTSYDLLSDNSYIDILSTSRNAVVVCDSDKGREDQPLKTRVQNLIDKLETVKTQENGYEKDISEYVYIWVTIGREIENYVPKDIFIEVLSSESIKKHHFRNEGNANRDLTIDLALIQDLNFGLYESFDKFFSKMYVWSDDRSILDNEKYDKISLHYSQKKVEISKATVEAWNNSYYEPLDLRDKVLEIIRRIKISNGLR
ncbi:AAA family ATPase [Desulfosporosinus sp. BG]|uniref:ATP-dependent nuclease n=1 Tax=Desulfosporosinus sp. BG TaxID=1633135 RepID=UPI00083A912F|nr:AAA family ATPase [Desulfosporosinus sp. BG]ODA43020.1 ATP-dependent endonuclease, OLD family [Desulfosporosinus sp. BG]